MTDPIQTASERFSRSYSCSQSVFSAFAPRLGLTDDQALKLASPFGGGTAHRGHVCGAVTGALLVLGLARGNSDTDKKEATYHMADEYLERFQELHGTILCRELISQDISTSEGLQAARDAGAFENICPGLVKEAAELVAEFLEE